MYYIKRYVCVGFEGVGVSVRDLIYDMGVDRLYEMGKCGKGGEVVFNYFGVEDREFVKVEEVVSERC